MLAKATFGAADISRFYLHLGGMPHILLFARSETRQRLLAGRRVVNRSPAGKMRLPWAKLLHGRRVTATKATRRGTVERGSLGEAQLVVRRAKGARQLSSNWRIM